MLLCKCASADMYTHTGRGADRDSDAGPAEGQHLLQGSGRPDAADRLLQAGNQSAETKQGNFRSDKNVQPSGQEETKASDVRSEVVQEKKPQQDTKEEFTIFNCKPTPSCWDFLPEPVGKKWKQLKRFENWFY